jgi:hypothetical protein
MSEQRAKTSDPVMQPFVDFWASYLKDASEATQAMFARGDGADLRAWQRRWLDAVSASMDAYMRSPGFLEAMKHNLDHTIQAKVHTDNLTKEIARNLDVPTVSDISGLFERMHSIEDTIVARLSAIEQRLARIEQKLG